MICPVCQRPTNSMVYRRGHRLCADCADPDFLRVMDLGFGAMGPDMAAAVGPVCERYLRHRYGLTAGGSPASSHAISPRPAVSTAREVEMMLESMGQQLTMPPPGPRTYP